MRYIVIINLIAFSLLYLSSEGKEQSWRYQLNLQEYDTMALSTFYIELENALQKEKRLKEQIADEQALIENLRRQNSEIDERYTGIKQEKLSILGITEQDIVDAENEILSIRQKLDILLGLGPDELDVRKNDVEQIDIRINALKIKPAAKLWHIKDKITELEELSARVKANMPVITSNSGNSVNTYTVRDIPGRRDCLWRIAGYPEVYGDPAKWPYLYEANKRVIKKAYNNYRNRIPNPRYNRAEDLLFPGQVLTIPR